MIYANSLRLSRGQQEYFPARRGPFDLPFKEDQSDLYSQGTRIQTECYA